jgi:hypothetical protein
MKKKNGKKEGKKGMLTSPLRLSGSQWSPTRGRARPEEKNMGKHQDVADPSSLLPFESYMKKATHTRLSSVALTIPVLVAVPPISITVMVTVPIFFTVEITIPVPLPTAAARGHNDAFVFAIIFVLHIDVHVES